MSHLTRKFIAILMLLWLPVFSASALAASVTMQLPSSHCHDESMQMMPNMDMSDMDMADMDMGATHHHGEMPADEHNSSCNACGVCHLACTGYLAAPDVAAVAVQTSAREITPFLVVFHSFTSAPLLPPPLVRA